MIIILLLGRNFKGYIKVYGVTRAAIVVTFVQNFAQYKELGQEPKFY